MSTFPGLELATNVLADVREADEEVGIDDRLETAVTDAELEIATETVLTVA